MTQKRKGRIGYADKKDVKNITVTTVYMSQNQLDSKFNGDRSEAKKQVDNLLKIHL